MEELISRCSECTIRNTRARHELRQASGEETALLTRVSPGQDQTTVTNSVSLRRFIRWTIAYDQDEPLISLIKL